eukprot:Skav211164  [mRNA]  locus=scaffold413:499918:500179:- [translate_table: standard]
MHSADHFREQNSIEFNASERTELKDHQGSMIYARTGLEDLSCIFLSCILSRIVRIFASIRCHSASLGDFKLLRCDTMSS